MNKYIHLISQGKGLASVLVVLSTITVLPIILACLYVYPQLDDWTFAYKISKFGRLGFMEYMYTNWSGRYLATALLSIPKADPLTSLYMYRVIPIVFTLLTFVGTYIIFRSFLRKSFSTIFIFAFSSTFTAFYIVNLTELFSALYWNCSSYYLLMNFVFLLYITALISYFKSPAESKYNLKFFLLALLTVLVCGLTEIHIIILVVFFSISILFHFIENKKFKMNLAILLLVTVVGAYLNILSPGSVKRMEVSDASTGFIYASVRSLYDFIILQIVPLLFSPFIFLPFVIFSFSEMINKKLEHLKKLFNYKPIYTLLFIFFASYLQHAASIYGAGYNLQGRVTNISNLLFYFSLLYLCINCIFYYDIKLSLHKFKTFFGLTGIVIMFLLNFSPNSRLVIKELAYDLPQYKKEMNKRLAIIKEGLKNNKDTIILPEIKTNPKIFTLGAYDPDRNQQNSKNIFLQLSIYTEKKVKLKGGDYNIYFKR